MLTLQPRTPTRRVRLYDCKEQITGLPRTFVPGPQTPASTGSSSAASTAPAASTAREYNGVFNNYMGLGIEAHGIYAFHSAREAHPERFSGRLKNQALMGALGLPTTGLCGCCCPAPQLKPRLKLSVRRASAQGGAGAAHISPWEEVALPSRLKAIILVNIPSHSAGANPWGSARSAVPQDFADGVIEVVGAVNALHGLAYLSLNKALRIRRGPGCFKRLAQAAEVRLELLEPLHVQVDGEPWLQPPGTFAISCTGKSNVRRPAASLQPVLRPDPEPSNPSPDPSTDPSPEPSPAFPTETLVRCCSRPPRRSCAAARRHRPRSRRRRRPSCPWLVPRRSHPWPARSSSYSRPKHVYYTGCGLIYLQGWVCGCVWLSRYKPNDCPHARPS